MNFIQNISPIEWLVIALIIIILFGRKVLVGLGRAGGETLKELKNVKNSLVNAVEGNDSSKKKEGVE